MKIYKEIHNYQSALESANHKLDLTYQKANKTTKEQRKKNNSNGCFP